MASLKKLPVNKPTIPKKALLQQRLQAFLVNAFTAQLITNPKLLLAYSGGLDSSVLLHLLYQVNKTLPFQLSAQHVHHELSPNADYWADFCASSCKQLHVPLAISKLKVEKTGLGLEAAARDARYQALKKSEADFILLAHHQDDQAETFLLQLARGAGVKGLAGMAAVNGKLLRPLLDAPRSALLQYAKQHNMTWIEDESNADTQFDRNFMRQAILPVLQKKYPAIRQTISRSAQHMAQANDLLDDLAQLDAIQAGLQTNQCKVLGLVQLRALSASRVNNLLRWWLTQNGLQMPSEAQLQQINQQLLHAKIDAQINIQLNEKICLKRYQHKAYLVPNLPPTKPIHLLWQGEKTLDLPDGSQLMFSEQLGQGASLSKIKNAQNNIKLSIQYRQGGEFIKADNNRPSRSLKVMLKNADMPPWQRDNYPLIFIDNRLLIIPNLAVDVAFKAAPNETGLVVDWMPI